MPDKKFHAKPVVEFKVTETIGTIWNSNDFSDSLTGFFRRPHNFNYQKVRFESGNSWTPTRSKPLNPLVKKNDTSLVIAFLMKILDSLIGSGQPVCRSLSNRSRAAAALCRWQRSLASFQRTSEANGKNPDPDEAVPAVR